MADEQRSPSKRWYLYVILAIALAFVLVTAGQWWISRPKKTAEHFISLMANSQFAEAKAMMLHGKSLQISGNGDVTIIAEDDSAVTLPTGGRRLMAGGVDAATPNGGFLRDSYDFDIAAFLVDAETSQEYAVELHAVAVGGKIVVKKVD